MPKAHIHPTDLSVFVAQNGHALVFQGCQQALFISRQHMPRFLENPKQAGLLVIPAFAATALCCYIAAEEGVSIAVAQDISLGSEFSLVITTNRGSTIAYFSAHEAPNGPSPFTKLGSGIVITPKSVMAVDPSGTSPALSPVASIPFPQVPDYPGRFAVDPTIIKEALQEALYKANANPHHAD